MNIEQLSLLKYRGYRYVDSVIHHVIYELLEVPSNYAAIDGRILQDFVNESVTSFRNHTDLPDPEKILSELSRRGLRIENELKKRELFTKQMPNNMPPSHVVHIVGAPRSGTSFLYYSLAYTGLFAYFTSESHYRWSTYNLSHSKKKDSRIQVRTYCQSIRKKYA